jgi:hypothetical protein
MKSLSRAEGRHAGPHWQGTCVYTFEPPRWVQKRRRVEPSDDASAYDEPRRATCATLNGRFSLVAVGTHGGGVLLAGLPAREGVPPPPESLALPAGMLGVRETGAVQCMEWSADGYVLAVGWKRGWALWSVGGRCLASSFGADDHQMDADKFQDAFMHGVRRLVSLAGLFHTHHFSPAAI